MCGIVAGVGAGNIVPLLIDGLKRLEYRGYNSAGVAVQNGGAIRRVRAQGKVRTLEEKVLAEGLNSNTGIAHTRCGKT